MYTGVYTEHLLFLRRLKFNHRLGFSVGVLRLVVATTATLCVFDFILDNARPQG